MQQTPNISSAAYIRKELAEFAELLGGRYGTDIERLWWDHYPNGCGMGAPGGFRSACPNGSFPGAYGEVIDAVRREAPGTLITNGPDSGNTGYAQSEGNGLYPVWNGCSLDPTYPLPNKVCKRYSSDGPVWQPRQTPSSLQLNPPQWFWHPKTDFTIMSPSAIWDKWVQTVGGGSHWLLNVPPNSSGLIPAEYHAAVKAFGDGFRQSLGAPVAELSNHTGPCSTPIVLSLRAPGVSARGRVDMVQVREDVREHGQKIASYALDALYANGTWAQLKLSPRVADDAEHTTPAGQTVGHRVVDLLEEPLPAGVTAIRFRCLSLGKGITDATVRIRSFLATARPAFAQGGTQ